MAFTVEDFQDLLTLLDRHPEWREELFRRLASERFLALPESVDRLQAALVALAEAQRRTEERLEQLAARVDQLAERLDQLTARVDQLAERLDQLTARVDQLAEAQRRTEERLEQLAARVDQLAERLDQLTARVDQLAEAQRRTEERLEQLAARVDQLAERLDQLTIRVDQLTERLDQLTARVDQLAEAQRRTDQRLETLSYEVSRLKAVFGATVEEEAASVARAVLREKGYVPQQEAFSLAWNGEVDVVFPVLSPEGQTIWVLIEAKARLSTNDVVRWAQRVRSADWLRELETQGVTGPYLVYMHGIRIDMGARKELEQQGIGLLHSQGELLAPKELIYPARSSNS